MGTAGQHLEQPPSHPVKTRFNVGQAVDSSAIILLTILEQEHSALIAKYNLSAVRKDLEAAMLRKKELEAKAKAKAKAKRSPAEEAELTALKGKSQQNWEGFIWGYVAPGQTKGFFAAVTELFTSPEHGRPARNMDYEFWIHAMVVWLFEKKKSVSSWEAAIRAYNGSGAAAEGYQQAITRRNQAAASAAKKGTSYVPEGI